MTAPSTRYRIQGLRFQLGRFGADRPGQDASRANAAKAID